MHINDIHKIPEVMLGEEPIYETKWGMELYSRHVFYKIESERVGSVPEDISGKNSTRWKAHLNSEYNKAVAGNNNSKHVLEIEKH